MNQDKAHDFWQIVVDGSTTLCELLDASPAEHGLQDGLQRIGRTVQTLRDAAADIDPLLTVEVDQVPAGDSAVLRVAISCNYDPNGIEAVQALVAAALAMPPRIEVCAFTPPTPKEMARELTSLEILGQEIPVQQVRFMAEPSTTAPGTFNLACFVPRAAVTGIDPQSLPGALVADVMLSMGIGELCLMTRGRSVGIVVAKQQLLFAAIQDRDFIELVANLPAQRILGE